jgi:hypothetical protein
MSVVVSAVRTNAAARAAARVVVSAVHANAAARGRDKHLRERRSALTPRRADAMSIFVSAGPRQRRGARTR